MVPLRQKNLSFAAAAAVRGPRELASIWRRHRQAVKAIGVRHADGLLPAVDVYQKQLEVFEPQFVRREDYVLSRRMDVGRPAHRLEIRQLPLVGPIEIHRPDVGDQARFIEPPPDDALAVWREERAAIVAANAGEPAWPRAVRVRAHDVNLPEIARVGLELLALGRGELAIVCIARRREDDPLAVRREARFRVVAT